MKLKNLILNHFGACQNLQLQQFSPSFNIVHGSEGCGKSTVRHFIRAMIYGFEDDVIQSYITGNSTNNNGHLDVDVSGQTYSIAHVMDSTHPQSRLQVSDVQRIAVTAPIVQNAISAVPPTLYTAVFNTSFTQGRTLLGRLIVALKNHLGVPVGPSETEDRRAYDAWQIEQNRLTSELAVAESNLTELNSKRASLQLQIETSNQTALTQRQVLQSDLDVVSNKILQLQNHHSTLLSRRDMLLAEIGELKDRIAELRSQVQYTQVDEPVSRLTILYERLDEIDENLRRWKAVQADVQNQRLQIKNEMDQWNSVGMDSVEHPYHKCRQIIGDLESLVDNSERNTRRWMNEHSEVETAKDIAANCVQMRDRLYAICQELGDQYKHVRHRAAVAELKQLRRCFTEISENIRRLTNRRNNTIDEIRVLDPAGAEAIDRAEYEFCNCAQHDGYLVARRRFVGGNPTQVQRLVPQDTSVQSNRLVDLERELSLVNNQITDSENETRTLQLRQSDLSRQLNGIAVVDISHLRSDIARAENEINQLLLTIDSVKSRLNVPAPVIQTITNPVLADASNMVSQLTDGRINKIWIDLSGNDVNLRTHDAAERTYSSIAKDDQNLVSLALLLAAARAFTARGIHLPVCLDDLLENTQLVQHDNIVRVLESCAAEGLQVILFTRSTADLNRFATAAIRTFELSPLGLVAMTETPVQRVQPEMKSIHRFERFQAGPIDLTIENEKPARRHVTPKPFRRFVEQTPPVDVETVGLAPLDQSVLLRTTELFESDNLTALAESGIHTVADLLDIDPDLMDTELTRQGISSDLIVKWQSQTWLKIAIPELSTDDTLLLFFIGIDDPRLLDSLSDADLSRRLSDKASQADFSNRFNASRYDLSRMDIWRRSYDRNRSFWKNHQRYLRRSRRNRRWSDDQVPQTTPVVDQSDEPQQVLQATPQPETNGKKSERPQAKAPTPNLKFYLNLADDLEAAPSIGPKTAERFANVGIATVQDFLDASPVQMAKDIDYKRIKVTDIEQWQNQTRLVCQVPNLRGHDAQLLVACEVTDPDELAQMDPEELFSVIGPFSKTKEGQKIVRSAKQPDLAEITDWIQWAGQNRSLRAA